MTTVYLEGVGATCSRDFDKVEDEEEVGRGELLASEE